MKKNLVLLLLAFLATTTFGQDLPLDPDTRVGVLDNGMTYYIRHNEMPENRAEFYIAQKVGAILEEENQRGLAHFLEHMAFNGTTNFPGKNMLDYLERNGVKFGTNVNAYTGVDETVYMLVDIPTTNPGLVDSCLLVLHDWSSFISLEEAEIDKERGVILEELRSHNSADQRMMENVILPAIYPNSNYCCRLPGGLPEVVASFEYQTLRDYYHKWYRPDLQGIIIVGDIDVDAMENRIKEMFADIKLPENPAPRTVFEVEDNAEPIVAIASDPEASNYMVYMFTKHDIIPREMKNSMDYFVVSYVMEMISDMMNFRYQDLTQSVEPPFAYGYSYYGNFYVSQTKDAWTNVAMPKNAASIDEALTTILLENKRMQEFGFTNSEYERAKAEFMKQLDSKYAERNKQKNDFYVQECLSNFMYGEPMMGIETDYAMYSQIIPMIPLDAINALAKEIIREDNIVITLMAPQVEGEVLPTEQDIINLIEKAKTTEVQPYEEFVSDEPLLANVPKAGKIKKETTLDAFGATVMTLKNGATVIIKPTDFKEDEILMTSYSWGGMSVLPLEDAVTVREVGDLIDLGGLGNFSATDLPKILAGKKVSVNPYVGNTTHGFRGSCSPKDLETMFQVMYLYFTDVRYDEDAFKSQMTRTAAMLENMEKDPMYAFQDTLTNVLYNDHPFAKSTKKADIPNIDYARALELYKEYFCQPSNYVFTFTGNIDAEQIRPLVETYIASLPKSKKSEIGKNAMNIAEGSKKSEFEKAMETPVTTIFMSYSGKIDYTAENLVYINALSDILDIIYTEKVREDEGGTYGVSTNGAVRSVPSEMFILQIFFQTNAEVKDKLIDIVKDELNGLATNGPDPVILQKVKDYLLKHHQENMKENRYWMNQINEYSQSGIDGISNYENIVNSITVDTMKEFAKQIINGDVKEVIQIGK